MFNGLAIQQDSAPADGQTAIPVKVVRDFIRIPPESVVYFPELKFFLGAPAPCGGRNVQKD